MIRILHFADAHIDIAAQGRHDPESGLPVRMVDFLKALDTIVDTAVAEKVDMVIFAGDAYKDRTPVPTYQREWGKRIIRLSQAGIPTLLLVGNHDVSPAANRANTLEEYDTLQVPHVIVVKKPGILKPEDLEGLPLQIIALPWISRSGLLAHQEDISLSADKINAALEGHIDQLVDFWINDLDPSLPAVLTAHGSVAGATYGAERSVMLGNDIILPGSMVKNPVFSYTALGHIHKAQDVNEGNQPPVIYPGSIERVDFGEISDEKFFVIAEIEQGKPTRVTWHKLTGRKFIDKYVKLQNAELAMAQIRSALPSQQEMEGAIMRLVIEYPREWESMIDESEIRRTCQGTMELHLIRKAQSEARLRLPEDQSINSLSHIDLLEIFWKSIDLDTEELDTMKKIAREIIREEETEPLPEQGAEGQ